MKKVALVYTVATEAMSAYLLDRLHALMGENIEVASYADESILQDVLHAGKITPSATRKLLGLYLQAMQEGARWYSERLLFRWRGRRCYGDAQCLY